MLKVFYQKFYWCEHEAVPKSILFFAFLIKYFSVFTILINYYFQRIII